MREIGAEPNELITPVELVKPEAREQVMLDGRGNRGLAKTLELAIRRYSRSDVEDAF